MELGTNSIPCSLAAMSRCCVGAEICGLSTTDLLNAPVNPLSRTAPTMAVPSAPPRYWKVPWTPPASLVSDGFTADMITLPIWETISPAPKPISPRETPKATELSV